MIYMEEITTKLESCGFTYSESAKYTKAILKKQILTLKELQYRLIIKFGVHKGKELYNQITGVETEKSFNYAHMMSYICKQTL